MPRGIYPRKKREKYKKNLISGPKDEMIDLKIQAEIDEFNEYDHLVVEFMVAVMKWDEYNLRAFQTMQNLYHDILNLEEQIYAKHLEHRFK